jgi:hypothetical protein
VSRQLEHGDTGVFGFGGDAHWCLKSAFSF